MINAKVIAMGKDAPDYEVVLSQIVHKVFAKWIIEKVVELHPGLSFEQAMPYIIKEREKYMLPNGELAIAIEGKGDDVRIRTLSGEVIL
jgi:hypothetical protein